MERMAHRKEDVPGTTKRTRLKDSLHSSDAAATCPIGLVLYAIWSFIARNPHILFLPVKRRNPKALVVESEFIQNKRKRKQSRLPKIIGICLINTNITHLYNIGIFVMY